MRILIKRIVGFIEYIYGVFFSVQLLLRIFLTDYLIEWKNIIMLSIGIMFGIGFIKYGWRWMFNIFDVIDENELKSNDPYYQEAVIKAQLNIELFLGYLIKDLYESYVLVQLSKKKKKDKKEWVSAEYLDSENIQIFYNESIIDRVRQKSHTKIVSIKDIEDWYIVREDMLIGLYSIKASSEKAIDSGQNLNSRTKHLLSKIIT